MVTLKKGSVGPIVEFLQNILKQLGFYFGKIDGIYGTNTRNAVINFQNSIGINSDGIVGPVTWNALSPYINGALGFIVPTNISYSSSILSINLNSLKKLYPFIELGSVGKSILGKNIPYVKIGRGNKAIFYSASFHANEWITSVVLMKFLADYCYCLTSNLPIFGYSAQELYDSCTLYIVPMVNPDGVDLVTGEIPVNSNVYNFAKNISINFSNIPFVNGWKANIRGVDLNLQFPAKWEESRKIKYSQGFTQPAPRDFVGYGPLTEPESLAIYNFTLFHDFSLILAYHSQGEVIYWKFQEFNPPNAMFIGEQFSKVSGYILSNTPYNSSFAGYKDWFIQDYNRPGYTIEVGKGVNPLPISQFDKIYYDNLGILVLGLVL